MKLKVFIVVIGLFSIYFLSYIWLRQTRSELWEKDGKVYVIFPEDQILYYVFRPLSYIDGKISGMNFHIGQHR